MSNQTVRPPHLNDLQVMLPITVVTDAGVTGTVIDCVDTHNPEHVIIVTAGTPVEITQSIIQIQESFEGGSVWNTIGSFDPITAQGTFSKAFRRTKRYLRAVVLTETPALPTAPAVSMAIILLF